MNESNFFTSAETLLDRVQTLFDQACAELADKCSCEGKLDARLTDDYQICCYELALSGAELLCAKNAIAETKNSTVNLNRLLALHYAAEAVFSIKARLEPLLDDFAIPTEVFNQVFNDQQLTPVLRQLSSTEMLSRTGEMVVSSGAEVGDIVLDDDKVMMQDAFRRMASQTIAPHAEEIHRQDITVPDAILDSLREMGVFGLSVPEQYGGIAPDEREDNLSMIVVTEALSQASLAAAGSLITRPEIMTRALLSGGTAEQKAYWLPKIAEGEPLCGIAITEPDYGSDVASLSLKAVKTAEGWRLNGAKTWCTFAGKAGLLLVVARTAADSSLGYKGLSIFLVEKPSYDGHNFVYQQERGGKLTGRAIATIGYRGMHSFDLNFEDFMVPESNLLGGEAGLGKGFYFTMSGLIGGRIQTAARASGVMLAALDAALRYAVDRKVFGAPLSDYQLSKAKFTRMAARVLACRQLTYAVGRMLDKGQGQMEASLVKLFSCRSAEWITREALQIHGGMGYAEESAVSRYFVDARVLSIFEGAEETLALKVIARELLQRALKA